MFEVGDRHLRIVLGTLFVLAGVFDLTFEPAYRLLFGRASYSTEASVYIPESKLELVLDRRCIHLFLAEYERTLIVRDGDRDLLRLAVADDSGGYSRMDVYRLSESEFYLSGDSTFDRYYLNVSGPSISRELFGELPSASQLLGSFDRDEIGWRFIPANREEF